ncbi:hypothetical protein C8R44DRAFT_666272 [Mycena epipterygia]|nr:hypothetical protein C8R44DRAFT_666272 [Mycena epipterygia]
MPKRKTSDKEDSDIIEDVMEEAGLTSDVLATLKTHPESTKIVAELANRLGIKNSALKRARLELPSFWDITWSQVADHFHLSRTFNILTFGAIRNVTLCYLPPSFHRELFTRGWSAMDVYAEPLEQGLDAPRTRLLDIYLVPIFAFFAGRIEDYPERATPDTTLSSDGSVEHQFFVVGNILFFVIELNAGVNNIQNNVAQLFSELFSASKMNSAVGFESLTVYGLLTDLTTFHFFSFEPISQTFYRDAKIAVSPLREEFLRGMMPVVDKIFSLVLQGYVDTLKATCTKSEEHSSGSRVRPSLETWERAQEHALAAQTKLKQFSSDFTALEESAAEGLKLLTCSVGFVTRTTEITSKRDIPSKTELEAMAEKVIVKRHVDLCEDLGATPSSSA